MTITCYISRTCHRPLLSVDDTSLRHDDSFFTIAANLTLSIYLQIVAHRLSDVWSLTVANASVTCGRSLSSVIGIVAFLSVALVPATYSKSIDVSLHLRDRQSQVSHSFSLGYVSMDLLTSQAYSCWVAYQLGTSSISCYNDSHEDVT